MYISYCSTLPFDLISILVVIHDCIVSAQKRKHAAANASVAVNGPSPFHVSSVAATQRTMTAADKDEGSSDEEMFDADAQWYWRDDKRYSTV